jgi:hypothetical protein
MAETINQKRNEEDKALFKEKIILMDKKRKNKKRDLGPRNEDSSISEFLSFFTKLRNLRIEDPFLKSQLRGWRSSFTEEDPKTYLIKQEPSVRFHFKLHLGSSGFTVKGLSDFEWKELFINLTNYLDILISRICTSKRSLTLIVWIDKIDSFRNNYDTFFKTKLLLQEKSKGVTNNEKASGESDHLEEIMDDDESIFFDQGQKRLCKTDKKRNQFETIVQSEVAQKTKELEDSFAVERRRYESELQENQKEILFLKSFEGQTQLLSLISPQVQYLISQIPGNSLDEKNTWIVTAKKQVFTYEKMISALIESATKRE